VHSRFQIPPSSPPPQDQDQNDDDHRFNSFHGLYIGSELINHMNMVDPEQIYWPYVVNYINSFPFSSFFFNRCFPFYMGSNVSEMEVIAFYQTHFCDFVNFFQMNHPDWNEYERTQCLEHFKVALELFLDDEENGESIDYRANETTPRTLEKPHFKVYEGDYSEDDHRYVEQFVGVGYFADVNGVTTSRYMQLGEHGPYGCIKFNLQRHFQELEESEQTSSQYHFYLTNGKPFDFHIDEETKTQTRFLNNSDDELFLFEESFQREKEEIRKQQEEMRKKEEEKAKKYYEAQLQLKALMDKNRRLQQNVSLNDYIRNTSQAFRPDAPSMIEIQMLFASQPILPFQHLGLPVPRANPTDYRDPLPHYNEEDEIEFYKSDLLRSESLSDL
jgi:hypothetical protein